MLKLVRPSVVSSHLGLSLGAVALFAVSVGSGRHNLALASTISEWLEAATRMLFVSMNQKQDHLPSPETR